LEAGRGARVSVRSGFERPRLQARPGSRHVTESLPFRQDTTRNARIRGRLRLQLRETVGGRHEPRTCARARDGFRARPGVVAFGRHELPGNGPCSHGLCRGLPTLEWHSLRVRASEARARPFAWPSNCPR